MTSGVNAGVLICFSSSSLVDVSLVAFGFRECFRACLSSSARRGFPDTDTLSTLLALLSFVCGGGLNDNIPPNISTHHTPQHVSLEHASCLV